MFRKLKHIHFLYGGVVLFMIAVLFSCTGSRKTIKQPIKEYGADYLLDQLKEHELQFDYVSAKFSIDLIIDRKETSFNGQFRLKKDSILWISFSPLLGIEAMRMIITNDSVKLINRINKTYFINDKKFVSEFLQANIDFDVIQSLLIGNDLTYYEESNFRASYDNPYYQLITAERRKLKAYIKTAEDASRIFIQNIFMNPETFKITKMKIKELKKEYIKLDAYYDDFRDVNGQLFPYSVHYVLDARDNIDAKIQYSKIKIDEQLKFPFKISDKYQPMSNKN